jgi:predicted alpha/beta superfamily hydrolase
MRSLPLTLLLIGLGAWVRPAAGQAQNPAPDSATPYIYPGAFTHDFRSKLNGRPYRLWVALPQAYASRPASRYPVLYLLDGGIALPAAATVYRVLNRGSDSLILVGVGYSDTQGLNYRLVDYSLPLAVSADSMRRRLEQERQCCQAALTVRVLREEIIPLIERLYRTTDDRGIFGHSVGGNFAAYVMFSAPDLFRRYGITSPSPWGDNATLFDLERRYASSYHDLPKAVFVSVGSEEGAWNTYSAARLAATLRARRYPSLDLIEWTLDNATHGAMAEYGMGLRMLYPPRWGAGAPSDSAVADSALLSVRAFIDAYNRRDAGRIRTQLADDSAFQAIIGGRLITGRDAYVQALRVEWVGARLPLSVDSLRASTDGPKNAVFIARSGTRRILFDVVRRPDAWRLAYVLHSEPAVAPVSLVYVRGGGRPLAHAEVSIVGEEGVLAAARTDSTGVARVPYDWRRSNGWYMRIRSDGFQSIRASPPMEPRVTVVLRADPTSP